MEGGPVLLPRYSQPGVNRHRLSVVEFEKGGSPLISSSLLYKRAGVLRALRLDEPDFLLEYRDMLTSFYFVLEYTGVQPGASKGRGWMVVSRHRRGDFDHFK